MSAYKEQTKDDFFMSIAHKFSELSHCVSLKVGAVAVKDNRIIATGINGTPAGHTNCDEIFGVIDWDLEKEYHHTWSIIHEIHAEMNVILYAARYGISLEGATLYCNIQPCVYCTKNLVQSGIIRIVYDDEYYRNKNNKELEEFIKNSTNKIKFEKIGGYSEQ